MKVSTKQLALAAGMVAGAPGRCGRQSGEGGGHGGIGAGSRDGSAFFETWRRTHRPMPALSAVQRNRRWTETHGDGAGLSQDGVRSSGCEHFEPLIS